MTRIRITPLSIALEEAEATSGKVEKEKEYQIWVKVNDPAKALSGATEVIHHEQVSFNIGQSEYNVTGGLIRLRRNVRKGEEPEYVMTIKTDTKNDNIRNETTIAVTEDMFIQALAMGSEVVVKDRFIFPIEGTDLKWEVDASETTPGSGAYEKWLRLEVEVTDMRKALPEFPFPIIDSILPAPFGEEKREDIDERMQELFEAYFVKKTAGVKFTNLKKPKRNSVAEDKENEE